MDDFRALIDRAVRAAEKMKAEYDALADGPVPAHECWVECEALWNALAAFGYGRYSNPEMHPRTPDLYRYERQFQWHPNFRPEVAA